MWDEAGACCPLVRDREAAAEAVLLHELRAFIAAALARDQRGLARGRWHLVGEAALYCGVIVVGFAVLCFIFGIGG